MSVPNDIVITCKIPNVYNTPHLSTNQNGRWNQSITNTKLFPIISTNPCPTKQSGRLFKNTHPNQSKKQLFSYLANNWAHLKR